MVRGKRRTLTRLSLSPPTAKVLEAPLEAAVCSTICSRSHALITRAGSITPSKYFNRLGRKDEAKKEKDEDDKGSDSYPSVENVFFIFGGPTTNMTARQCKQERREVFSITKATPSYLD